VAWSGGLESEFRLTDEFN